jgi:zinc transporter, ZIP family
VGVGFGAGEVTSGLPLAIGIGLQNIPEGLAVAAGLATIGYGATRAFTISLATGLVEGPGAAFGAAASALAAPLLPWTLSFAAGAMLFVILGEIIPEVTREESKGLASLTLIGGFLGMMVLVVGMG